MAGCGLQLRCAQGQGELCSMRLAGLMRTRGCCIYVLVKQHAAAAWAAFTACVLSSTVLQSAAVNKLLMPLMGCCASLVTNEQA